MSWIRRSENLTTKDRIAVQDGPGHMIARSLIESDSQLNDKGRLLARKKTVV